MDDHTTKALSLSAVFELQLRGFSLEVLEGPDKGQLHPHTSDTVQVGTGQSADLRLTDELVSRKHTELRAEAAGVRIIDRGSRNGTFMGDTRVHDVHVATDTQIRLGDSTVIAVRLAKEPTKLAFSQRTQFGVAVAHSEAMRHVFRVLELAAARDGTVLIEGESGTGKDVLARSVHAESPRKAGPFVIVDCGAIPANLIESELFGHEKGAFTGAVSTRPGAFEQADGGTLFLDEIGELPLEAQPKLLRALESRAVRRVGGTASVAFDVRVIAATNRRLKESVRCKEFREDLYYRLAVVKVAVPALRERRDDIPLLAQQFFRAATSDTSATLPKDLLQLLSGYDWPGNARELRNVIERFATFRVAEPDLLFERQSTPGSVPGVMDPAQFAQLPYAEAKQRLLDSYHQAVLPIVVDRHGSVTKAAEALGISRTSLYRILQAQGSTRADD
jgi:two-component system response regulator GlrR